MFMGPKAFIYYLTALISYIKSDQSFKDDSVLAVASVLQYKVDAEYDEIESVIHEIKDLVNYVLINWEKFTNEYYDDAEYHNNWKNVLRKCNDSMKQPRKRDGTE